MTRFQIYLLLLMLGVCALVVFESLLHDSWPIAVSSALNGSHIFFKYTYEEISERKTNGEYVRHIIETNSNNVAIVFNKQKPRHKINKVKKRNKKRRNKKKFSKKSKSKRKHTKVVINTAPLKSLAVIPQSQVKRILLFAYFRSGSSFVGDLLQQNENSFYSFEPLSYMSRGIRIDDTSVDEAVSLIDSIFRCQFEDLRFYTDWAKLNQYLFKWNKYLCDVCRYPSDICFEPKFLSQLCKRSKVQLIKEDRLHMRHLRTLLPKLSDLDVRVVYLVRDPRGTYKSRQNMLWCRNETKCSNVRLLCSEMTEDIDEFGELQKLYPNRLTRIRYEDLSTDPYSEAKALFDDLGIPFASSVRHFIDTHTNSLASTPRDAYSTERDSKNIAYDWKRTLNASEILRVQQTCKFLLEKLSYEIFDQSDDLIIVTNTTVV